MSKIVGFLMGQLLCAVAGAASQSPELAGHWQGTLARDGASVAVSFDFTTTPTPAGRFSSDAQRAMDYPLDSVTRGVNGVHFVLGGDMTFDGALMGNTLSGNYRDGEAKGSFTLHRVAPPLLPYRVEPVRMTNGTVTLAATLIEPTGKGPFPAVVLLHGSGPESRWGTNRFIADRLARAGIAALIYDKRGSGESSGDWRTADYEDLARDALAGVALLVARPEIDAARIGLHGHSQGGIVAAAAVHEAPGKIAFVVAEDTVAGPVYEQDLYRVEAALAREFPPDSAVAAMAVYRLFIEVARGLKPYSELSAAEARANGAPWLAWLSLPPEEHWLWPWYLKTGTVDTLTYWRAVKVPVFIAYGEEDAILPVRPTLAALERTLDQTGALYTAVIVPRAQHNLTIHPAPGEKFFFWHAAPGFIDLVVAWVKQTTAN
jgi:pimeloyl-ACP methyl ester carboxylesterase